MPWVVGGKIFVIGPCPKNCTRMISTVPLKIACSSPGVGRRRTSFDAIIPVTPSTVPATLVSVGYIGIRRLDETRANSKKGYRSGASFEKHAPSSAATAALRFLAARGFHVFHRGADGEGLNKFM